MHAMTKVIDIINKKTAPFVSFELVPPLKGSDINKLYHAIEPLMEFEPPFINITFHRDEVEFRQKPDGSFEKVILTKRPGSVAIAAAISFQSSLLSPFWSNFEKAIWLHAVALRFPHAAL